VIKVLIVDDSATARLALRQVFEADPEILVVGEAENGTEALALVRRRNPDLVTMDVFLRREDGLDVAASIMRDFARPILIVTAGDITDPSLAFRAMEAGALEICRKLPSPGKPEYPREKDRFLRLVKSLSRVPVVHRAARARAHTEPTTSENAAQGRVPSRTVPRLVALGASTGGPPVVCEILNQLPKPYPLPIALVQHMAEGFISGFADWLARQSGHPVVLVEGSTVLSPGTVHIPGENRHLLCVSATAVTASTDAPRSHCRPSVDILFESCARHFGGDTVAVLLTGMGRDGVTGLSLLRQANAMTIAQSPPTCAVDSMPRQSIEEGAARLVLDPGEIARKLVEVATVSTPRTH